jgi:hypothetical protein
MEPNSDHKVKFAEYEKFWRRVLIDVLGWSEKEYLRFVSRQKTCFLEGDAEMFFHDLPYKYVCPELLSPKLKEMLQGGDAIRAGYLLMDALSVGPLEIICAEDFDIEAGRNRYLALLERLERFRSAQ